METILKQAIESHDTIIIHRHKGPDYDALGSQVGLKALIRENYPQKDVYVVGDENLLRALGQMDHIEDHVFDGALSIIVDVAGEKRTSDERFTRAKTRLIIDHHQNPTDIDGTFLHDPTAIAAAQMIARMAQANGWRFNEASARALLMGIITDSGRFLYPGVSDETFRIASLLMSYTSSLQELYQAIYQEPLHHKKLKGDAMLRLKVTASGIAYLKNSRQVKTRFGVDDFTVSRGLVSVLAHCEGAPVWVNFTEIDDLSILVELRAERLPVVEVARQFGGGGHTLACGCIVQSWEETDKVIEALEALQRKEGHHA